MNRSARRFLLSCLLLIALPVKGYAATGVLACGPNHHNLVGGIAQAVEPVGSTWHGHGDGATHQHAAAQNPALDLEQPGHSPDDATAPGHAQHAETTFKCGTCAPCCAGAALTGDAFMHVATAVTGTDFPAFAPALRSAPVGRLDRPPRIILA